MISWDVICLSKEKKGLAIRSLSTLNKALFGKQVWSFAVEDNLMWKKVISLKYQIEEEVGSQERQRVVLEWAFGRISIMQPKNCNKTSILILWMVVELNYGKILVMVKDL